MDIAFMDILKKIWDFLFCSTELNNLNHLIEYHNKKEEDRIASFEKATHIFTAIRNALQIYESENIMSTPIYAYVSASDYLLILKAFCGHLSGSVVSVYGVRLIVDNKVANITEQSTIEIKSI